MLSDDDGNSGLFGLQCLCFWLTIEEPISSPCLYIDILSGFLCPKILLLSAWCCKVLSLTKSFVSTSVYCLFNVSLSPLKNPFLNRPSNTLPSWNSDFVGLVIEFDLWKPSNSDYNIISASQTL